MAQRVLPERVATGGRGSEDVDGAADNSRRRRVDPPAGAALVVAGGAEVLLLLVVGAGQARNVVAVAQAGPVAGADLEKMRHGGLERADGRLIGAHLGQQCVQVWSDRLSAERARIL